MTRESRMLALLRCYVSGALLTPTGDRQTTVTAEVWSEARGIVREAERSGELARVEAEHAAEVPSPVDTETVCAHCRRPRSLHWVGGNCDTRGGMFEPLPPPSERAWSAGTTEPDGDGEATP